MLHSYDTPKDIMIVISLLQFISSIPIKMALAAAGSLKKVRYIDI